MITKTLFKDINTTNSNFEENWELAITEVIVNLEEKINTKKTMIQKQLKDLDSVVADSIDNLPFEVQKNMTQKHSYVRLDKENSFITKSFDQAKGRNQSKKSVKWQDERSKVDISEDLQFLDDEESHNEEDLPLQPRSTDRDLSKYKKYIKQPQTSKKPVISELDPETPGDLEPFTQSQDWEGDEMNILLGLNRDDQPVAKTLIPTCIDQSSLYSSQHLDQPASYDPQITQYFMAKISDLENSLENEKLK